MSHSKFSPSCAERVRQIQIVVLLMLPLAAGCSNPLVNMYAFNPEPLDASVPVINTDEIKEISIETVDGEQLQAFFYPRPASRCVLLYLHGNGGSAYQRAEKSIPFSQLGCNLLLLSYRGYGKSSGSPTENWVYRDAQAALAYLAARGFEATDTFVLGSSLGSAIAVDVAQNRDLGGLILVAPFSSGRELALAHGMGFALWFIGSPFDSLAKLPNVRCPVLVVHGDQDRVVPPAQGRKLFDAYRGDKKMVLLEGAGHNDIMQTQRDAYLRAIGEVLTSSVKDLRVDKPATG